MVTAILILLLTIAAIKWLHYRLCVMAVLLFG